MKNLILIQIVPDSVEWLDLETLEIRNDEYI